MYVEGDATILTNVATNSIVGNIKDLIKSSFSIMDSSASSASNDLI